MLRENRRHGVPIFRSGAIRKKRGLRPQFEYCEPRILLNSQAVGAAGRIAF